MTPQTHWILWRSGEHERVLTLWGRFKPQHGPRALEAGCLEPRNLKPLFICPSMESSPAYAPFLIFIAIKICLFFNCAFSYNRSLLSFRFHYSPSWHWLIRSTSCISNTQHGFYRFVKSSLHSIQPEDHFLHRFWRDNHFERQWVDINYLFLSYSCNWLSTLRTNFMFDRQWLFGTQSHHTASHLLSPEFPFNTYT